MATPPKPNPAPPPPSPKPHSLSDSHLATHDQLSQELQPLAEDDPNRVVTVGEEQMKRSLEMQKEGVDKWMAAHGRTDVSSTEIHESSHSRR